MLFGDDKVIELQDLYESNQAARSLLDYYAERERSSKKTSVDRAEFVTGEDYYDLVAVFKKLESIGVGKFLVGRKGHESRMVWDYDVVSIGQAAQSKEDELEPVPKDAEENDGREDEVKMKDHEFYLRPDLKLSLTLPDNFTVEDANKMKAWIDFIIF